jgi:hypothetical protein
VARILEHSSTKTIHPYSNSFTGNTLTFSIFNYDVTIGLLLRVRWSGDNMKRPEIWQQIIWRLQKAMKILYQDNQCSDPVSTGLQSPSSIIWTACKLSLVIYTPRKKFTVVLLREQHKGNQQSESAETFKFLKAKKHNSHKYRGTTVEAKETLRLCNVNQQNALFKLMF